MSGPLTEQPPLNRVKKGPLPGATSCWRGLRYAIVCAALGPWSGACGPNSHIVPGEQTHTDAKIVASPPGRVIIRTPEGSPRVATSIRDERQQPVTLACASCHTTRPPDPSHRLGQPLNRFHQHVVGSHGQLSCTACHNPAEGYETLRRADGTTLAYADVMLLCAQCHGPQYRDFLHGAHGGMTGYWDLSRGDRQRNNCIDCHAPHGPRYPTVLPAPGPNDRKPVRRNHD